MYSDNDDGLLYPPGFPIRNPPGQSHFRLTEDYRRLRVLLRLLMPRHPPTALKSLTKKVWLNVTGLLRQLHKLKLIYE